MTRTIKLFNYAGDFAENKDTARNLRINFIEPILSKSESIILDFNNVSSATQSFIHALISETIRKFGIEALDRISFKNCNSKIQTIVEIVVEYVQDGIFTQNDDEQTIDGSVK